jgi:hypothetical protein
MKHESDRIPGRLRSAQLRFDAKMEEIVVCHETRAFQTFRVLRP